MTTLDIAEARRLAAQFRSHPVSRSIDEIEAAGEMLYALVDELEQRPIRMIPSLDQWHEYVEAKRQAREAADELERLRAQVAALAGEDGAPLPVVCSVCNGLVVGVAAPAQQADTIDAKRWRHLRDVGSDAHGGLLMMVHAVCEPGHNFPRITTEACDYDAAIDAAMAAAKEQQP